MPQVPGLVTVDLWGVRSAPGAVLAMARDRWPLRHQPGLTFAKLLGTGSGSTFLPRDADLGHWGVLACWRDSTAAARFEGSALVHRWRRRSHERLHLELVPLTSKGRWASREPFGRPEPTAYEGPVAVLTRARVRPRLWRAFWAEVPPVAEALQSSPGLMLRLGIGEAPVGLQGTLSIWSSTGALDDFAHHQPDHLRVIARTREVGWYAEELFARFALRRATGTYAGTALELPSP